MNRSKPPKHEMRGTIALLVGLIVGLHAAPAVGQWPQLLGPARDGVAAAEETLDDWRQTAPRVLWRYPLGGGYAGPVVQGALVIVTHRQGAAEKLVALDREAGKVRWSVDFPATYQTTIDPDGGPRATPVVGGDRVLCYGAAGDLRAVELATGKVLWQRALRADLDAPDGYFGAGSTPLVLGDRVIVCVGGRQGAVVALALDDGKVLWTCESMEAAYASPVRLTTAGRDHVLCVMRLEALLIDPSSGQVVQRIAFGARGPTVNAATPLVHEGRSLLTASYGIGAKLVDWTGAMPETVWKLADGLSSQYVTPVRRGEWVYGIDGREDMGSGQLRCVAWKEGKVVWTQQNFGIAHLILVGDRVLAAKVDGGLEQFRASPKGFEWLGSAERPAGTYRAASALAQGVLFTRSTDQESGELIAIRVGR